MRVISTLPSAMLIFTVFDSSSETAEYDDEVEYEYFPNLIIAMFPKLQENMQALCESP